MAKRGRKPKGEKKGYFYEREENAIVNFLQSESEEEKNEIFNTILMPAFTKMIESIIRRYNLYVPDEEFQETFDDTISFLMTKIHKFKIGSGFKAYSYCGTICKNYLIFKINQYVKNRNRNDNIDDGLQEKINNDMRYSYGNDQTQEETFGEIIYKMAIEAQRIMDCRAEYNLKENELKVGMALVSLLENWEELFATMGSNKFNKSAILLFLKETTLLDTKEIRNALKKYKEAYVEVKRSVLEDIY